MEVPAVSVNSLRHQLVREPSFLHLCDVLGFEPVARGEGPLPVGIEALFSNGGNIEKGAAQSPHSFRLAGEIRKSYPSLDLLGGCTSVAHDLGESRLKMRSWIVCSENANNLPESLRDTAQAKTSIFDMLDNVTRTRHASAGGAGQMIYNFETLISGAIIYVELTLTPYTAPLTCGALAAALDYYTANDNVVGGQSARGHGNVSVEWLSEKPGGKELYEEYLAYEGAGIGDGGSHKLRDGMTDGTLGTGTRFVR